MKLDIHLKLLVIHRHPVVIAGLTERFSNRFGIEPSSIVDAVDVDDRIVKEGYSLLISDVRMGDTDLFSVLRNIRNEHEDAFPPVVAYSGLDNPTFVARGIVFGIVDFVSLSEPVERIETVVEQFSNPTPKEDDADADVISEDLTGDNFRRYKKIMMSGKSANFQEDFPLSQRECQVLRNLALGLSNREIGMSLSISVETVKEHVQNVLRKTKTSDRTEAAVKAVRSGFLEEPAT